MLDAHSIIAAEVGSTIEKLKPGKMNGSTVRPYYKCIAILFTMMLRHGLSPDGMLHGTMVPFQFLIREGGHIYPYLIILKPLLLAVSFVNFLILL